MTAPAQHPKGSTRLSLRRFLLPATFLIALASAPLASHSQSTSAPAATPALQTPAPQTSKDAPTQEPAPPKGTVLFQSHGEPPAATELPPPAEEQPENATEANGTELTDTERSAITFTAYDLDVRLVPATSRLSARARLTVRNDGAAPLTRIALQISSTLHWESGSLLTPSGSTKLELGQHLLDTDADHTGKANEAVFILPGPLAPGQTLELDTFYSGTAAVSTDRLQRLGATHDQALAADWDGVGPRETALRGFGNVLWYPVASPQVFLGEGAQLFEAIGHTELAESAATVRLHLGVEYKGDPPNAAYFCGRRQALKAVSDDPDEPISTGSGIATAEFSTQPLGFRTPNLVLIERPEALIAPLPLQAPKESATTAGSSSSSTEAPAANNSGAPMLAVVSDDERAQPALAAAAEQVTPLLQEWLGEQPLSALTVIDHGGQPFEDGPLLLAPVASLGTSGALPAVAHSLTHAWVQTGQPWMDEGLAQFMALLWIEQLQGREAAVTQLANLLQPLAIAEPNVESGKPAPEGQPLIAATSEIFFRRKGAAVWFMLRSLAGDKALQSALLAWRLQPAFTGTPAEQAHAFEVLLEKLSGKDLGWLFDDWVLHDRGLPDLSIADVATHQLPAGTGHNSGWLVAVTVHNDGAAAAEVPVVVRSGAVSTTSSLRIPGFSSATARVLVEVSPTEVLVNDGGVPEVQASRHSRELAPQ